MKQIKTYKFKNGRVDYVNKSINGNASQKLELFSVLPQLFKFPKKYVKNN